MGFFRDGISKIVFPLVYILMVLETISVYYFWDDTKDSWLFYTKVLYLFNTGMAIWCHIMATITDPGTITHQNNIHVLEIYINIRSHCVKNADNFNAKFRSVLLKMKDEELQESDSDLDNSDYGYSYDIHSDIRDYSIEEISKEYRVKLSRCKRCLVVRPPRSHHCTRCKKCFLKKDHHCPWINNCIGAFNQKHFLLFNYYVFWGILNCMWMMIYYSWYMHYPEFRDNGWCKFRTIGYLVINAIFLVFSIIMMKDQIGAIRNETALIDPKKKIFIEARDIDECWNEAFGEPFHIRWFFPVNKNWIRDSYIKGKLEYPPEDPSKKDEKKDKKKKDDDEVNEENFEEMLKAAVQKMKKEKEEESKKGNAEGTTAKKEPKTESIPSNSDAYEEMLRRARENLFSGGEQSSPASKKVPEQANRSTSSNNPLDAEPLLKQERSEKAKQDDIDITNKKLKKAMNGAMQNFEEYYQTTVDANANVDSDDSDEVRRREGEMNEADEMLGKLNDFMSSMKSKIEENKKKAEARRINAEKKRAAKMPSEAADTNKQKNE